MTALIQMAGNRSIMYFVRVVVVTPTPSPSGLAWSALRQACSLTHTSNSRRKIIFQVHYTIHFS
jgi:hypothetical protein